MESHRPTRSHIMSTPLATRFLTEIWTALGGPPNRIQSVAFTGEGDWPSVFAVSDLAAGATASAGLAIAELAAPMGAGMPRVTVDRRLASLWFASTLWRLGW